MRTVLSRNNGTGLTTEAVLRAGGALSFDDVYGPYGLNADIFGVQPELGFYCLWSHRPGDPAPVPSMPDCANITATATQHAAWLSGAGFDYVTVDWTNWPQAGAPAGDTDVTILRPTETLFDEWAALRARGVATPSIAVWPCSPAGSDTWQWALTHLYQNASRAPLVWRDPVDGRPVMFIPASGSCYDDGVVAQVRVSRTGAAGRAESTPRSGLCCRRSRLRASRPSPCGPCSTRASLPAACGASSPRARTRRASLSSRPPP